MPRPASARPPATTGPSPPVPRSARNGPADRSDTLIDRALTRLTPSSPSPRLDAEVLLGAVLGQPRSSIIGHPERDVSGENAVRFRDLVEQRAAGVPVAHLTGWREFYSLPLRVTPATLVPRPETELLIDTVLDRLPGGRRAAVLDAGTGCGAVALAVKHRRSLSRVVAVDCSVRALTVAASNGTRLGLRIDWLRSHWFDAIADARFDLVAANPPYVPADDEALLSGDLRHEPRLALDGGADGLASLREIADAAPRVLAPGGSLALEHGCDQAPAVRAFLNRRGFRGIETFPDLAGHDRVTIGNLAAPRSATPPASPGRQ